MDFADEERFPVSVGKITLKSLFTAISEEHPQVGTGEDGVTPVNVADYHWMGVDIGGKRVI